jgi:hypothetical protein
MVHAYLMYGFPTQTAQETIDSLEMVRQLFKAGILQSAFWHQFAMTAHSPVGLNPEKFGVKKAKEVAITFADNDVEHIDETGTEHDKFSFGLKKSLLNYMHGLCLDDPLHKWFDAAEMGFKVPKTSIDPNYIVHALQEEEVQAYKPTAKIVWLGKKPSVEIVTKSKKGNSWELASLSFQSKKETVNIKVDKQQGEWFASIIEKISVDHLKTYTLQEVKENYEAAGLEDFELFWDNKPISTMNKIGLLRL